jgi:hypothetical protein
MISLIAHPDSFEGRRVQVQGFVHFDYSDSGIYFDHIQYEHLHLENALYLEVSPDDLQRLCVSERAQDMYMIVQGTFHRRSSGHLGGYSMMLDDLTRIQPLYDPGHKHR